MRGYKTVRSIYHFIIPPALRDRLYDWSPSIVKSWKRTVVAAFERDARHDDIYDSDYYEKFVEPTMRMSARTIATSIVDDLRPNSVVDVGCGTGVLLDELRSRGVTGVGLELADAAIAKCKTRNLDVRKFDIEQEVAPNIHADLVVSTEVAEHLPERCADDFVDVLCGISRTIVLTAATPSQGGTDHVNEQPNQYWIDKIIARGYIFDEELSIRWRDHWKKAGVAACFWSSVMIFRPGPVKP